MPEKPARTALAAWGLLLSAQLCVTCRGQSVYDSATESPSRETGAAPASAAPWPPLPRTSAEATSLLAQASLRDAPPGAAPLDALVGRVTTLGPEQLIAGEARITAILQARLAEAERGGRRVALLWGSYHDAPAQLAAFGRLVGPGGLRGLGVVAAEQFRADGAWAGVAAVRQRGDDEALARYVEQGDLGAFDALREGHREADYAAWKFGYESIALDLLTNVRAARPGGGRPPRGPRLFGCDMTPALKAELAALTDDERLRLRELHCALALRRAGGHAAIAYGQAHVQPGGLRRFLQHDVDVVALSVFGGRHGAMEGALAARLALLDPVLVPLNEAGSDYALLLPEGALAVAEVDRVAEAVPHAAGPDVTVALLGTPPRGAQLRVGAGTAPLDAGTASLALPVGEATMLLEVGALRVVAALPARRGVGLRVTLEPGARRLTWTELGPP